MQKEGWFGLEGMLVANPLEFAGPLSVGVELWWARLTARGS